MRTKINQKAWENLNQDEQAALSIKLGYGKSTWEAGEVMEKAHYKFLEIEARARYFLKLFTEHFELYDQLVPDFIKLEPRVRKYLVGTMAHRRLIKDVVDDIDDPEFSVRALREELIIKDLKRLVNSDKVINKNFALLVFDFDRWNNYRILPAAIQEPSAFKRRNKNNDKKNIKNLVTLNSYSVEQILKRYKLPDKSKHTNVFYMPVPSGDYGVVRVSNDTITVEQLSRFGFFLFYKEDQAWEFYDHLKTYSFDKKTNNCKGGQVFWANYRKMIKNSNNYNNISKRIASRKFLESALRDMDVNILNPKNTDPNTKKKRRKKSKELGLNNEK